MSRPDRPARPRVQTGVLRPSSSTGRRTHYGRVSLDGVAGWGLFGPLFWTWSPSTFVLASGVGRFVQDLPRPLSAR